MAASAGGQTDRVARGGARALVVLMVALLAAAVTVPIACLVILGLQTVLGLFKGHLTTGNYMNLLTDPATRTAFVNTLIFTAGGALVSVFLGTTMAWAVTSVRISWRGLFRMMPLWVLILPPLVKDPACVILYSPDTGLVNMVLRNVFGIEHSLFNVYSMFGMIMVMGIFAAPTAYIIMLSPLESMDRSFLDASRMSGAPLRYTLRRVVLPMVRPAMLSAITLLIIVIASAFETPVIIGTPARIETFMSQLFQLVNQPINGLNVAAAQGSLYVVLTFAMVVLYMMATRNERRFVSISGKGHTHDLIETRRVRYVMTAFMAAYTVIAFLSPLAVTILTSLVPFYSAVDGNPFKHFTADNYRAVFTTDSVTSGIITSGLFGLVVAVGVVLVAGVLAYVSLKTNSRFRRVCEMIAMAPIAVPALVYSVGLLLTALSVPLLRDYLYQTKYLMFIASVIVFLPITMRVLSSALIQIQDELLEASQLSGASRLWTIRYVLAPILWPAILYAISVVFVSSYRELGAVIFLVPADTNLVPNLSFGFWVSGGYPQLSALNIVALFVPLIMIGIFVRLARLGKRAPSAEGRKLRAEKPTLKVGLLPAAEGA
jgi:iron(III) transport system permease protein